MGGVTSTYGEMNVLTLPSTGVGGGGEEGAGVDPSAPATEGPPLPEEATSVGAGRSNGGGGGTATEGTGGGEEGAGGGSGECGVAVVGKDEGGACIMLPRER